MVRPSFMQEDALFDQDPYILGLRSEYLPGYIRDFDPNALSVRYPNAAGRLVGKGVGAVVNDPLGVAKGMGQGIIDLYQQGQRFGGGISGLTSAFAFNQGQGMAESGQRLASGDYGGMSAQEEEEARVLDLLTMGEALPLVGFGAMGMKSMLRRGTRVPDTGYDPSSITEQGVKVGSGIPKMDMIEGSPAGLYNQTVTQSAVDLINDPAFGEGFAERLMEVAAENSIAVGDRTFMPMDVYAELAERVNNPAFKVVDEDLAALASYDSPDIIKQMFLDDEYAADILGEVRSFDGISDAAPMSDVTDVRNVIYQRTQDRLRDLPDVITVYRAGPLNDRDGVSSFTLNPSYNPSLELPWHKDRGSPVLESFTVRKEDILGSPDIIREFGESELIIRNSSVVPKYATGGLVSGIGSLGGEFL